MKTNNFRTLLQKITIKTFRNTNSANSKKLIFDPKTMNLPDFVEEPNHGAEKAFGKHAQAIIDSLRYAKVPPKFKRSVNMARLGKQYEEIFIHLERELVLNALEEGDNIPIPTISTALAAVPPRPGQGLLSSGIDPEITCNFCKKPDHTKDDCRKLKRKKEGKHNDCQTTKKEYPKCPICNKTNHPAEWC